MANSENVYIKGKSRWSSLYRAETSPFGGPACYKQAIYPDSDSLNVLRQLQKEGIKNLEKRDDDGSYFQFRRPVNKEIRGDITALTPPEVLDKDGNPLRETAIGRGSDITVKLEVYSYTPKGSTKKVKAARLASVRVDNLVPFKKSVDYNEAQTKLVEGLMEQPKPNFNF